MTKSNGTSKLPRFVSPTEAQKLIKAGKLEETEMKTVATISLPSPTGSGGQAKAAAAKKRLSIKCVVTADGAVCTYKWV